MIVDGRALAKDIVLTRTKDRASRLSHPPRVLAIVANETPATKSYLAVKQRKAVEAGCVLEVRQFPESVSAAELQSAIAGTDADAIIVQLPLPEGVDTKAVCDAIPIEKDVDVLSSVARAEGALLPPVVGAVQKILESENVEIQGKTAVVIGDGFLVGKPVAIWLRQQLASVSTVKDSINLERHLRDADIIVSGAGSPHFIKPEMLKEGVVLIDAGTSESNGELAGDADPSCAEKCSLFTPVPGGVGPVAVACLFENVVTLAERAMNT